MNNEEKIKEIYVDIDLKRELFRASKTWELIRKNLIEIEKRYGKFVLYIRTSSSGNVHLKIEFENAVTVLDMFMIRSLMHDDIYRIGIDLRRLFLQGSTEINRIFDMKARGQQILQASDWELLGWR